MTGPAEITSGRRDRDRLPRGPQGDSRQLRGARGPRGFTNLVAEHKPHGEIVLAPHITAKCVIIPGKDAATALFDVLGKWLR